MLRLAMPIDGYEARARHLASRGRRKIPLARGILDEDHLANAHDARAVVRTPLHRQIRPTLRLLLRLEMRSSNVRQVPSQWVVDFGGGGVTVIGSAANNERPSADHPRANAPVWV
jgi:hypothetical protein